MTRATPVASKRAFFAIRPRFGLFCILAGCAAACDSHPGASSPRLWIASGNGQVVAVNWPATEPLTVQVADAKGNPLPGVEVSFRKTDPAAPVQLHQTFDVTDGAGTAILRTTGKYLPPGASFGRAEVEASMEVGGVRRTVIFSLTIVPSNSKGVWLPETEVLSPDSESDVIHAKPGETIHGAIRVRTTYSWGPDRGRPAQGVGLTVRSMPGDDPDRSPEASCEAGMMISDSEGIATCDLKVGEAPGVAPLLVEIGYASATTAYRISVER